MPILQLNHVAVHVADVERSRRFYADVLRLEQIARPAFSFDGAWFRLGQDQELHLIAGRGEPTHSHSRSNHFALLVDDVGPWEQHFASIGFSHPPRRTRPDGAAQLFVIDPDGHWIELCTVPP